MCRLISHYAYRPTIQPGKAHHYILAIMGLYFKEITIIHYRLDQLFYIVRLIRIFWYQGL